MFGRLLIMCIACEIHSGLTSRVIKCDVFTYYNCTVHFVPSMIHLPLCGHTWGQNKCHDLNAQDSDFRSTWQQGQAGVAVVFLAHNQSSGTEIAVRVQKSGEEVG